MPHLLTVIEGLRMANLGIVYFIYSYFFLHGVIELSDLRAVYMRAENG